MRYWTDSSNATRCVNDGRNLGPFPTGRVLFIVATVDAIEVSDDSNGSVGVQSWTNSAGSAIEFFLDRQEVLLRMHAQVGALKEVVLTFSPDGEHRTLPRMSCTWQAACLSSSGAVRAISGTGPVSVFKQ